MFKTAPPTRSARVSNCSNLQFQIEQQKPGSSKKRKCERIHFGSDFMQTNSVLEVARKNLSFLAQVMLRFRGNPTKSRKEKKKGVLSRNCRSKSVGAVVCLCVREQLEVR